MVLRAAAFAIVCILWIAPSLGAAPIPVQFTEGVSRGFLTLRSQDGGKLADGDILQTLKGEVVESRLVFHFVDGSLYDETVAFSQHRVFTLQRYHLVQRGPSFSIRLEISFDRETGQYKGWYADEEGGEKTLGGTIEMPPDLYNGMIAMLLRNLPRGASETVQMVTFTPKPRLVKLHLSPLGEEPMLVGDASRSAIHYQAVPEIFGFLGFFVSLIGQKPPTLHFWITREEIPALLGFEGPLFFGGPVWRVGSNYRTDPPREVSQKR